MIMRDLTQKLDCFYSAAATGNTREQVALKACQIILGAMSSCASAIDSRTGDFLPMSMLELVGLISATITDLNGRTIDRIGFMADFLQDAICGIINNPREEIVRTHQMLPLQRAKSFDQASIRWLIRRQGESIAQKCALSRRVMTVKREFVPDTLENRLFKEFVRQFIPLLQHYIANVCGNGSVRSETQLLALMKKWLREHSEDIKPWRNLPPNNTLLGDKNYRKIWDSWRRLTDFPDTLSSDVSSTTFYRQQILFLCIINQLQEFGVRFAPVPAKMNLFHGKFDRGGKLEFADHEIHGIYINDFNKIVPLTLACNDCILIRVSSRIINIRIDDINHINVDGRVFQCVGLDFLTFINDLIPKIIIGAKLQKVPVQEDHSTANQEHISVDLNNGRPTFYSNGEKVRYSSLFIARQYWNFSGEIFSLPLKEAKACICSDHCETRAVSDFWHDEYAMADVSRTAADFARDIYSSLPLKKCDHTLLLPDMLDEMSDSARILKRALDAEDTGHRADWLPTCIAALFAVLRKSPDAKKEGQTFCFLERFGNTYSITSVMARKPSFSEELGASVPESCGLIWERHPSFKKCVDSNTTPARQLDHFRTLAPFPVLGEKGPWTRPGSIKSQEIIVSEDDLRQGLQTSPWKCRFIRLSPGIILPDKYRVGNLTRDDLTRGAEILHTMQQKCPQYPLWTDDLPKLLVTAHSRDNKLETRPLVSDDHEPVKTIRGQRTKLTTDEVRFILPQGQKEPYVDLQRGEGQKKESYRVRLHLQRAPEKNITCKLNLYYTFGAANPYSLEFTPIDPVKAGFGSVKGEPQRFTDDSNAFAAPEFPPLTGWNLPTIEQQELNQEIDKFHKFWVRNLEDFVYFSSFDSAQEIIDTQVSTSFIGHAGMPVDIIPADEANMPNAARIKCFPGAFAAPECYENFPARTELLGVRVAGEASRPFERTMDKVIGLHNPEFLPVRCKFRYTADGCSVWETCDSEKEIRLYRPFVAGDGHFLQGEAYDIYFSESNARVLDWEPRKVKIVDDSHIQILHDRDKYNNKFYEKNTIVFVPKYMLKQAIAEHAEYVYATFRRNTKIDRIDVFISQSPPEVISDAVIQTQQTRWERFIPARADFDFARNEDGRPITCYVNSFTGGADEFARRTTIPTWYALVGSPKGRNLSAKIVSSIPLGVEVLRNPAFFGKSYLRGRLKSLTRNGRRPFTASVPEKLKKVLSDTGSRIMELLKRPYMPYQQKQMLVETLATYGDFQPEGFGEWLLEEFSAGATFSFVAIGYAIGDLQQIWQRQLWELILKKWRYGNDTSFISPVTGIAISRYDEVLQAIPPETGKIILDDISTRLKVCCEQIKRNMKSLSASGENDVKQLVGERNTDQDKQLCRNQLQFLLSMLRLRKSTDEVTRNILHPSSAITRKLQNDIQELMALNLHDLTVRVQGEEKNLLDEVYGFLTGANQDEFMELEVSDDGEETPDEE